MATIVYLDVEDEITSAASRIRTAADTRVGLVLPFGSRVATSRINFRLLAREAQSTGRQLDIVAPDASARALAASAGLSVFASVGEYEAALDADDDAGEGERLGTGTAAAGAAIATGTIRAASQGTGAASPGDAPAAAGATTTEREAPAPGGDEAAGAAAIGARPEPRVVKPPRGGPGKGVFVVLFGLIALIAVGAVAAYLVLPTADITVTPVIEPVGPISFSVTADPAATAVDPAGGVIPATTLEIPVTVDGEFPATGKRVEKTKAQGGVRFQNCDPSAAYQVPAGTIVRTRGGIGFATAETLFLPVATISGTPPSIAVKCQSSEVAVTAVEAGPEGNVGAGQIRVVPARYNRNLVRVSNPAATTGGSRQEFKRVAKKDVDAAVARLTLDANARFKAELENPDRIPAGTTVFPETAVLGELVTTPPDPQTLVGQEVDSFTLSMSGTGTVQAVDKTPVTAIAEARLQSSIAEGYDLIGGSTAIDVGSGTVQDGVITFDVRAGAKQVRALDAAALKASVLGLSEAAADAALGEYGDVVIVLWPDWAGNIPSLDQRVKLTIDDPTDPSAGEPLFPERTPRPTPDASASGVPAPAGSPADGVPSEPVPSG